MWFYMIAGFLLFVGIVGGFASGGIFTLIFIPLGAIMLVVAVLAGMWSRAQQGSAGGQTQGSTTEQAPLRHTPAQGAATPTSPEELVDARRAQQ
jgi:predicted phage tail protein